MSFDCRDFTAGDWYTVAEAVGHGDPRMMEAGDLMLLEKVKYVDGDGTGGLHCEGPFKSRCVGCLNLMAIF